MVNRSRCTTATRLTLVLTFCAGSAFVSANSASAITTPSPLPGAITSLLPSLALPPLPIALPALPIPLPALPALPVALPTLPALPIALPALPAVPALPTALPAVPALPVELPTLTGVAVPSLPAIDGPSLSPGATAPIADGANPVPGAPGTQSGTAPGSTVIGTTAGTLGSAGTLTQAQAWQAYRDQMSGYAAPADSAAAVSTSEVPAAKALTASTLTRDDGSHGMLRWFGVGGLLLALSGLALAVTRARSRVLGLAQRA